MDLHVVIRGAKIPAGCTRPQHTHTNVLRHTALHPVALLSLVYKSPHQVNICSPIFCCPENNLNMNEAEGLVWRKIEGSGSGQELIIAETDGNN